LTRTVQLQMKLPSLALTADQQAKAKRAQEAKSLLLSTLKSSEIDQILHCKTAKDIWSHFEKAYGRKTANVKLELMSDLNSFVCKSASVTRCRCYAPQGICIRCVIRP
jgi:hypothetical protein